MRKLSILKAIVDFFWIISLPLVPLLLIFIGFVIFDNSLDGFPIKVNGIEMVSFDAFSKAILVALMSSYLILLYCIFLFKKVLRYFKKVKLFDESVINNMNKIGFWLVVAAFLDGVPSLIYKVLYQKKIGFEIGLSPFLIMLCFGLFFMVLSEVFTIAKHTKEENELTI
ncbi:DUF2975 domain-containing protein [Algibacter sp.]|nr:DUF2975 domain-containing protein [Algibacter sp.]